MSENFGKLLITALCQKYRFAFTNSKLTYLTIEDICDPSIITMEEMNNLAFNLQGEIEKVGEKSFVEQSLIQYKANSITVLENKLKIVKHIISFREGKVQKAKEKKLIQEQLQLLLDIRKAKEIEKLKEFSLEEIDKQIADLGKKLLIETT